MKFDFELIFVFAGFVGWILFFIQTAKAKHLRRVLKRESDDATELFHLKQVLLEENREMAENAAGWRSAAWAVLLLMLAVAAVEAWKRWKAR